MVAVGEEELEAKNTPSHRAPWLPTPSESPPLVVRDLDQYVVHKATMMSS